MKKILSLGLLFAAILTLGLTGCAKDPEENEKLPGTWSTAAAFWDYSGSAKLTASGSTFTYKLENPLTSYGSTIPSGKFGWDTFSLTQEDHFKGFKAKASANSGDSGCGFAFCLNRRKDTETNKTLFSYYALVIQEDSLYLKQIAENSDDSVILVNWKTIPSLNAEPAENTYTVYTDTDNSIVIKINGEVAHIIENPAYTKGEIGVLGVCGGNDQAANKTISSTYKFLQFQK